MAQQTYSGIPAAFATGDVLTAANLNLIRDWIVASIKEGETGDTGEILPAIYDLTNNRVVLDAGGIEFSDGTTQTSAAGGLVSEIAQATVAAQESTTSTSYTDLATVGPTVTMTTGTKALVIITASSELATTVNRLRMSVDITGATTSGPSNARALYLETSSGSGAIRASAMIFYDALTAGSNTFKAKYVSGGATVYWQQRDMIVMDLGS